MAKSGTAVRASDRSSEPTYDLSCSVCLYGDEVTGIDAAFEASEAHREECGGYHFVEFTRVDSDR